MGKKYSQSAQRALVKNIPRVAAAINIPRGNLRGLLRRKGLYAKDYGDMQMILDTLDQTPHALDEVSKQQLLQPPLSVDAPISAEDSTDPYKGQKRHALVRQLLVQLGPRFNSKDFATRLEALGYRSFSQDAKAISNAFTHAIACKDIIRVSKGVYEASAKLRANATALQAVEVRSANPTQQTLAALRSQNEALSQQNKILSKRVSQCLLELTIGERLIKAAIKENQNIHIGEIWNRLISGLNALRET